ncbi:MAG: RNA polymerase sigma-70 factor [Puia sp.]|nr:RNA polymerase sigma-70 factor [Puia sp.]
MSGKQLYEGANLLQDLAAGDEKAYKELYRQYWAEIYLLILKYVKSPQLSQDFTQDVFLKIWDKRARFADVDAVRPYLRNFARNYSLNALKSISRSQAAMGEIMRQQQLRGSFLQDETLEREYVAFLQKTLDKLSPRSREIFRMCRENNQSYEEVAAALGISRSAVRKHMVNSLQKIREAAEDELGFPMSLCVFSPLLTVLYHNLG